MDTTFLDTEIFDNTLRKVLWFLGTMVLGFILKSFISRYLSRLLFKLFKKDSSQDSARKFTELIKKPLNLLIILVFCYWAFHFITYPTILITSSAKGLGLKNILAQIFYTTFAISITWVLLRFIDFIGYGLHKRALETDTESDDQLVLFFTEAAKIIFIIISVLFVLSSIYTINITSLVAGLGIGGIAFALAAKESLENLLGSFTIFLDRPFVKGDMVTVEGITGAVEMVGFRSTRIRTLEKSYVTVPNKIMVNAKLDNLTERTLRRVDFNIGVTYSTTKEQIKSIVTEIEDYLNSIELIDELPIVKFTDFADSSLNIRILYFLKSMDWNISLEIKQEVNFKIMDIVQKHKSDFAFPSRTVYLQQN